MSREPEPLNRDEVLRGIRISNWDAALYTAFLVFTGGPFLIGFARYLQLNDFWLGVVIAMPALVGILQFYGSIWVDTKPSRRAAFFPISLLQRIPWILIAFLPLLTVAFPRAAVFILCITLHGIASSMLNPGWIGWLGDLVSEQHRGWFFARRTAITGWVSVSVALPSGYIVDQIKASYGEAHAYAATFGLGVVAIFVSWYFWTRIPEPPRPPGVKPRTWPEALQSLAFVRKDKSFRRVVLFFVLFSFATTFPAAFFADYMLGPLKMGFATIQIFGTIQSGTLILCTKMWGYLADKYGAKPVVFITGMGVVPIMLCWLLTSPEHPTATIWYLAVGHVLGGLFWSGAGISQLKLIIETSPDEHRTVCVGAISSFTAVTMGLAPLAAGTLMQGLRGHVPEDHMRYVILFGITGVLRLIAALFVLPIRDPKSRSVADLVHQLATVTPSGVMALRALGKKKDPGSTEAAVERLGDSKMEMAVEELEHVLTDPQPSVRRKAVEALSKIGGDRAAQVIARQLRQHPEFVVEEMIEALGETGTEASTATLAPYLESPSPGLRIAAARALGAIGGADAVEALKRVAYPGGDPDLRRVAVRALARTGSEEGYDAVVDALDASEASIRIVAAEAVAAQKIEAAIPLLRTMLPREGGMVAAEMAYALGSVGALSDTDIILEAVRRLEDRLPRKRAVLGLGRLYDVETRLYRLMVLTGMELDEELLGALKTHREASALFSAGDEAGAIRALAAEPDAHELIRRLAEQPTRESFLLSVALLRKD